jgi:hypothetical protein
MGILVAAWREKAVHVTVLVRQQLMSTFGRELVRVAWKPTSD